MARSEYRSDIDGLRAVAVLGVVIYHAFPRILPGGYSGVDIFFVISGYLIYGIIDRSSGKFNFKEFYSRRIKRLFPSLIVVLALCLAYGYFVLINDEYRKIGQSIAASGLFVQNILFFKEVGYFDVDSSQKILLHLWSLAVEEQFYIIFPLFIFIIGKNKWNNGYVLIIFLITAFILNLYVSRQSQSADFYLTTSRAWEFLAGSLLFLGTNKKNWQEREFGKNYLAGFGFLLILMGLILLNNAEHYPGWRALLPVLGCGMVISAGNTAWLNKSILSHPAIVWIGLISYPLYLFHWPALAFVHIIKGNYPQITNILSALLISFILATGTYYIVEKKLRNSKSPKIVLYLMMGFIAISLLGALAWKGIFLPSSALLSNKIEKATKDMDFFQGYNENHPPKSSIKIYSLGSGLNKVIYVGDSNMQQYAPRIGQLLQSNSPLLPTALFITLPGALPIPGVTRSDIPLCAELIPLLEETIKNEKNIKKIVFAALWHNKFTKKINCQINGDPLWKSQGEVEALAALGKLIDSIVGKGIKVTVILSIPTGEKLSPKSLIKRSFIGVLNGVNQPLKKTEFLQENGEIIEKIRSVAMAHGAEVIDPLDFLSTNGICLKENSEGPIYFDPTHLRTEYVKYNIKYLDSTLLH